MKKLKNEWTEGSVKEFLDLSDADVEYIEVRRSLSGLLKDKRLQRRQARGAKLEKSDT